MLAKQTVKLKYAFIPKNKFDGDYKILYYMFTYQSSYFNYQYFY